MDLNSSFGSGGISAWFRDKELPEFTHSLKQDDILPVKRAASILGRQPDNPVWVLSPTLQVYNTVYVILTELVVCIG